MPSERKCRGMQPSWHERGLREVEELAADHLQFKPSVFFLRWAPDMTDEKRIHAFARCDHYSSLLGDAFELNSPQTQFQRNRDFVGAKFYHNHTAFLSHLVKHRISASTNSLTQLSPGSWGSPESAQARHCGSLTPHACIHPHALPSEHDFGA